MADSTPPTDGHSRHLPRINWVQALVPLLIVALTATGSVLWHLLERTHIVTTLQHDIDAHEREAAFWKDKISELGLAVQADAILMQEARSTLKEVTARLESGTDDRFRGTDFQRERATIFSELKRLEDLCETRYGALEKRLAPIESHFWQYHWNGGHGEGKH